MEPTDVLTVTESAAILRVHVETVRRMIKGGRLPAARIGKTYRVLRRDLERLLTTDSRQVSRQ
jgi:excisionase family DNA binding protein